MNVNFILINSQPKYNLMYVLLSLLTYWVAHSQTKKYFVSDAAAARDYFSVKFRSISSFNLKKIKKTDLPNFSAFVFKKAYQLSRIYDGHSYYTTIVR